MIYDPVYDTSLSSISVFKIYSFMSASVYVHIGMQYTREGQSVGWPSVTSHLDLFMAFYVPKLRTYIFSAWLEARKPQLGAGV